MAGSHQRALDAFAQSLGYANYYAYRNARAKDLGYSGYPERRKALRSKKGLRGGDNLRIQGLTPEAPPRVRRGVHPPAVPIDRIVAPPPASSTLPPPDLEYLGRELQGADDDIRGILQEAANRSLTIGLPEKDLKGIHTDIQSVLKRSHLLAQGFLQSGLPDIAKQGLRSAGAPEHITPELASQGRDIASRALRDIQKALLGADKSAKAFLPRLQGGPGGVNTQRQAAGLIRNVGIRSVTYANGDRRNYGDYVASVVRAAGMRIYNGAFLDGATRAGAELFLINDGPDCGLTSHRDPQRANGMIIDHETAIEWPIAHPNCRRTFGVAPEGATLGERAGKAARAVGRYAGEVARESLKATAQETLKTFLTQQGLPSQAAWMAQRALTPLAQSFDRRVRTMAGVERLTPEQMGRDILSYGDDLAKGQQVPEHVAWALGTKLQQDLRVVGLNMEQFSTYFDDRYRFQNSNILDKFSGPSGPAVLDYFFNAGLDAMSNHIGARDGFVRFRIPRIGQGRGLRGRADLRLVNASMTKVISGPDRKLLRRFNLNPHGLLRAGFGIDDLTGAITPTLRLIPRGPIRVQTVINRSGGLVDQDNLRRIARDLLGVRWSGEGSIMFGRKIREEAARQGWTDSMTEDLFQQARVGSGHVTSASTQITVIAPRAILRKATDWTGITANDDVVKYLGTLGLDFSASINTNLRQLGLRSLRDVTNLKVDDWRKLRLKNYIEPITGLQEIRPSTRPVSVAVTPRLVGGQVPNIIRNVASLLAGFRMYGGTLPDFAKTFRVDWETAKKLWNISALELLVIGKWQDWVENTMLSRRYAKKITDINEVIHPYSRTRTRAGKGGASLRQLGLEPLRPLP